MGSSTAHAPALPSPRAADAPAEDLAAALLALADADADAFADTLHDGVLQALVVARYAADAVVRGGDPLVARDAVQEALVGLRRAVWLSRPRGDEGLAGALRDLAAHLTAGPALLLELDEDACAALSPTAASVAHRLVQRTAAAGAVPLTVRVTRAAATVLVALDAPVPDPAAEALRARAAGGGLSSVDGTTVLTLPLARPLPEELP